ncbi:MAG: hypothetical protein Q4A84_09440 [Neisseria sp.]|uniref:hypothetical protein n=1 Tax=Neisseria sp. TaxID=192066 RepID=UPI0026DAFC8F|nr:hypothetical protein [Neisseria sp.]MDO4641901.1 hypothetical protein [Neisseria sp.]
MFKKILITLGILVSVLFCGSILLFNMKPESFDNLNVKHDENSAADSKALASPYVQEIERVKESIWTMHYIGKVVYNDKAYNDKINQQEFERNGDLVIEDKPLASVDDYITVLQKLDYLKGKGEWYSDQHNDGKVKSNASYYFFKDKLIEVSRFSNWGKNSRENLSSVFVYANGRPRSALIIRFKSQDAADVKAPMWSVVMIWQPDGSVLMKSSEGRVDMAEYVNCKRCYADALRYLHEAQNAVLKTQYVFQAQKKSNQIAARNLQTVDYRNMPEIMPAGMKANSLVVGYDEQHRPEKIYWSYDNGKRRQSFEYYLENGQLFLAQSSSVPLTADGETADFNAPEQRQTWFIRNGEIVKEERRGKLPDYPLNMETVQRDISRYADAAQKRQQ